MDLTIVLEIRKMSTWLRFTLQEAEGHATSHGFFRERKRPKRYSNYALLMNNLIDYEPSIYEGVVSQQVWKDAMLEEYQPIMEIDVCDIVSKPEGKSVVTSKWVYKIKHAVDGGIDKYKESFVTRGFSQKEGEDYDEIFSSF